MRGLSAILLGVLLFANAASALELEDVQERLAEALELRIEERGARDAARQSRAALQQPLLWQAASMRCVDYGAGAAECVVRSRSAASPGGVGGSEVQLSSLRPRAPQPGN